MGQLGLVGATPRTEKEAVGLAGQLASRSEEERGACRLWPLKLTAVLARVLQFGARVCAMWFTLSCIECCRRRRQRLNDEMHDRHVAEGDDLEANIFRGRGWKELSAEEFAFAEAVCERQLREAWGLHHKYKWF